MEEEEGEMKESWATLFIRRLHCAAGRVEA